MTPRRTAVFSLALCAFVLLPAAAAPVPAGIERQLNESTPYWQVDPSSVALADGGFLAVWEDMRRGVVGRFVSPSADLVGGDLVLAANSPYPERAGRYDVVNHRTPTAVALSDGGFLLVWLREDALLKYSYFWSENVVRGRQVMAQRFTAAGAPAGDPWRLDAPGGGLPAHPAATRLADGRVAVVWQRQGADGSAAHVASRILDLSAGAVGTEKRVDHTAAGPAAKPFAVALADGGFLVVWTGFDPQGKGVLVRPFDAAGLAVRPAQRVNASPQANQGSASVAPAADGGFLVAWQHADAIRGEYRIMGRFLDAAGHPVGAERRLTVPVSSRESSAALAARPGGGFYLFWMGWEGTSAVSVAGLELDAAGQAVGEPVSVADERPQPQWRLAVAAGERVLVAWEGLDGRSRAIRGRVFAPAGPAEVESVVGIQVVFHGVK